METSFCAAWVFCHFHQAHSTMVEAWQANHSGRTGQCDQGVGTAVKEIMLARLALRIQVPSSSSGLLHVPIFTFGMI